jgi:hypothetical protein
MRNFLLAALAMLTAGAKVAPLEPGVYAFFNSQTGQVLDVWAADKREGAPLSTAGWAQGLNQAFALQTDDNENYGIAAFHTLKGLTITDIKKDVEVTQRSYVSAPSQQWRIIPKEKGTVAIQNKISGKFLTAGLKAGDKVIQANGNGQRTQLFRPFKLDHTLHTPIVGNAVYTFINRGTSLPIEIAGVDKKDGAKAITFDNLNTQNQQFQIVTSVSSPEFIRLRAVHSGKVLSVTRQGVIIQEEKKHGDRGQLFRFVESADGTYQIENQRNREAITVGRKMEAVKHTKMDANNKNQQFWAVQIL